MYRAVVDAELYELTRLAAFSNPAGIEVKYFSTTAEGAAWYAQQAHRAFGEGPFTLVEPSIPTGIISDAMRVTVDRGISTVIVPTALLP